MTTATTLKQIVQPPQNCLICGCFRGWKSKTTTRSNIPSHQIGNTKAAALTSASVKRVALCWT
jgi:hypothetical protein